MRVLCVAGDPKYKWDAMIPGEETHGGEEVGIYATGPSSYLFQGVHHQHYIAHAIMFARCLGDYKGAACKTPAPAGDGALATATTNYWLCVVMVIASLLLRKQHL